MKKSPHPGSRCISSCPTDHLPGIGPSIREDLERIGVPDVGTLAKRDPQKLYDALTKKDGVQHDPCVLYVFRCGHYAATARQPKPQLLLWWNWKDRAA